VQLCQEPGNPAEKGKQLGFGPCTLLTVRKVDVVYRMGPARAGPRIINVENDASLNPRLEKKLRVTT
jgi:hypothetical protein